MTRLAAAVVLIALGVLAALLAADVRSWRDTLATDDAVYAASPAQARWTAATHLGGTAGDLLRVRDDVELRRAIQRFRATVGVQPRLDNAVDVETARARAEDALARAARDSNPRHAAQARTLLGILAFGAAGSGAAQSQVDAAAADFADAVRADPTYLPAKYDLELLLRLTAAHGVRPGQGTGGGVGSTGHHGAGGGTPGRGY